MASKNALLKRYDRDWLTCRVGARHRWDEIPEPLGSENRGADFIADSITDKEWCRCERCGMLRLRVLSITERILYRGYFDAPDGYRFIAEGDSRPSQAELLSEYTRRRVNERKAGQVVPMRARRKRRAS